MTMEKPQVVTRVRRGPAEEKAFSFTRDMLPVQTDFREQAWASYMRQPMPTTQDEPWRRTDIRALKLSQLRLVDGQAHDANSAVPAHLMQPLTDAAHGGEVLLSAAGAKVSLASELSAQGVIFTDLMTAEKQYPQLVAKMAGKTVRPDEGKFAALAGALAHTGVLLYVPRGVEIKQPLHSLLWGSGKLTAQISHILVWVEAGASVTYLHESASNTEDDQSMHAGLVEIHVGENARLNFVELQSWGKHVWNFSHERANVESYGTLDWIFGAIGSRLTKNFTTLELNGHGATGKMSGFYFTDGNQHLDHDTQQNHHAPFTTSDLLFKGALQGESRSVWQGMIYVAKGAVKADGYQANRNLVLSKASRADSIPGLEILADDVRCTHGATVGKMDPTEIFYLNSRGIPKAEAERLIVEGFFDPIMQRIPFEGVRQRFELAIHQKMGNI